MVSKETLEEVGRVAKMNRERDEIERADANEKLSEEDRKETEKTIKKLMETFDGRYEHFPYSELRNKMYGCLKCLREQERD